MRIRTKNALALALACCLCGSGCGAAPVEHRAHAVWINVCWGLRHGRPPSPCPGRWDARVLLGKSYLQAVPIIASHDSTFQVQEWNGESRYVLLDFESGRVELVVSQGVITRVALG
jgi:hypothetical protein